MREVGDTGEERKEREAKERGAATKAREASKHREAREVNVFYFAS
jgi:hypothetical protein